MMIFESLMQSFAVESIEFPYAIIKCFYFNYNSNHSRTVIELKIEVSTFAQISERHSYYSHCTIEEVLMEQLNS